MRGAWEHLRCYPKATRGIGECPWAKPSCVAPEKDAGHPTWCGLEERIWAGVMRDLISSYKCEQLQWRCTHWPADNWEPPSGKTSDLNSLSKGLNRTKKSLYILWNKSFFTLQRQVLLLVLPPAHISCPAFLLRSGWRKLPGYNQDIFQVTPTVKKMWRSWGCFLPSFF